MKTSALTVFAVVVICGCALGDIVTNNLQYNWTADTDVSGNDQWVDDVNGSIFSFDANMSTTAVSDDGVSFTKSYTFPTARALHNDDGVFSDYSNQATDASFELWIKPASLSTYPDQIIFETGASIRGIYFAVSSGNTLEFGGSVDPSDTSKGIDFSLTTSTSEEWQQVVGVIEESSNSLYLYHNGSLVDSSENIGAFDRWSTNDGVGLGRQSIPSDSNWTTTFYRGEMASLRFYSDALTAEEVAQNYNTAIPEPGTFAIVGLFGLIYLLRRKPGRK